jgi:L-tyrosine isonitrile synthase
MSSNEKGGCREGYAVAEGDSALVDIDASFILISKNYLNDIEIDINAEFREQLPPRVLNEFPYRDQRLLTQKQAENYFSQARKSINGKKSMFEKIFSVLQARRYRAGGTEQTRFMDNEVLFKPVIERAIEKNEPITFVLPSFPFKCPNLTKVRRRSPDMAEILCLSRMYEICTVISLFYAPGAKFVIIADGQVYKDMFGVTSYEANRYRDLSNLHIEKLQFGDKIEIVDMLDLIHSDLSRYEDYKSRLLPNFSKWWEYHKDGDRIKSLIDACTANVASNTHVTQDLIRLGTSRVFSEVQNFKIIEVINQIRLKVKGRAEKCAFEYAFFLHTLKEMNLVLSKYPNALRCTVHPKPKQWGLHLVNSRNHIFPWHGAAFHGKNGWRICYEYSLIREESRPVHLLDECYPFFYESEEHPYIPGDLLSD